MKLLRNISKSTWQERGACYGATLAVSNLFTDHPRSERVAPAICVELCNKCEVTVECLEAGMHESDGIWGGMTPYQRKQILKMKHRVFCPGCGCATVASFNDDEVCLECGLSWRV